MEVEDGDDVRDDGDEDVEEELMMKSVIMVMMM